MGRGFGSVSRFHRLTQVWADGRLQQWEGSSRELMAYCGVAPRDLRLFVMKGAHFGVRSDYFVFRFPPFTGCVWSKSALILAGDSEPAATLLINCIQAELKAIETMQSNVEHPFELRVLELALRESVVHKQDRFARLSLL